ncbi:MAG TPA: TonB-dependent receptor [Bryobacteraceae bacterium]|nr:TonB-dependent receptor [Bryobacteraceae bacterium]
MLSSTIRALRYSSHSARLCAVVAVLSALTGTVAAQSTGAITGTVTDATNAVVPSAKVTVTQLTTGAVRVINTDNAGLYSVPSLAPGNYKLEAQAPGLQTVVANNLLVTVGSTTTQNFTLNVASSSQTVEIQASAPLIDTSSVEVGGVVNQRTVQEIPLNGRHFIDLALLIPGSVTPPANGFLTAPLRGQGSFSFNSAGAREDEVNFMINGVNMSDMAQNQITFQPTINTVDEFKVDNSTYGAEYGRNAGSIVNIATRAGTNQVHGEVYYFMRNSALDARNFNNPSGVQQAPFKRNQFGADGGGPIKKDKSFLFLSYEGLVQRQSVPLSTTVLSAAQRASVTDPIVQKLLPLIPLANSPGNVFVSSAVAPVNIHQGTANFSQVISDRNRFNAYYAMQHDLRDEPPSTDNNSLPNYGDQRQGWRQLLTLNDIETVSSNVVNEARAGFNRIHIVFAAENQLNAANYGINSGVNAAIGLPQITVTGAFAFGGVSGFPQGRGDDNITFSDTVSWVKGAHSIKLGAEYHRIIDDSFSYSPGTFTFPSISAFLGDQASQFTANSSNHAARIAVNSVGAFVQDSWKATSRLTLDLGLRYDWYGTPSEAENRFVVFDPTADALEHIGSNGGPSLAYNQSALNFEPRVGFAYDVFGTGKTVVRSAYAIFVDQPITGLVGGLVNNPPYALPVSLVPTASAPVTFANAYSLAAGTVSPVSVAHNYRDANVQSWNFNIQQQLGNNYSMMIGYFANKGTDLNIERNYNQPINGVRPYATLSSASPIDPGSKLGNILVYESDANSSYNALWLTFQKQFAKGLQFSGSYTFSKSIDENSRNEEGLVIQNSYDIAGDRGLSDFDARNRFVLNGVYDLPFKGKFISGWEISLVEQIQSGNPINFHTSNTTFVGAGVLRPSVTGPVTTGYSPATNGNATFITYIQDPSAFVNQGNAFGSLGRNVIIGPGFSNLDASLIKNFKLREGWPTLQFHADAFDLLNQANWNQPSSTVGPLTFGLISGTRFPAGDSGSSRQLQLALKLTF